MPTYSMADVVNDVDFAQVFVVTRSSGGSWVAGNWANAVFTLMGYGIIQPASAEELNQVPEGDRVKGAMSFHSQLPLYETHSTGPTSAQGTSDVIAWQGQNYKLVKVYPWEDFGYYKAIGVRISGE